MALHTELTPLERLNGESDSKSDDETYWWDASSQTLSVLLQHQSNYSDSQQLSYLRWFQRWIMPALGPRPSPIDGSPHYGSWLTYDSSRIEYSLNWKENTSGQTIRFTIDPASPESGTPADPLNQLAARNLLMGMAKEYRSIDLTRFHIFYAQTRVPDDAIEETKAKNPPGAPLSTVWVAFDFEGGEFVAKTYFLPDLKALCTGIPTKNIIFDAIRKCNGPAGSYNNSIGALDDYLESFSAADAPHVMLLAHDCVVDSSASRCKVYVHPAVPGTLAVAKDMFHLGGRLSGLATVKGLKTINDFWCRLFDLDRANPRSDDFVGFPDGRKFVFGYEMRPTQGLNPDKLPPNIEVKLYIPLWRLGKTDAEISAILEQWFKDHNGQDFATKYKSDLASAFPKHNFDADSGTHTYISLTFTEKTGLYMTMYYSPKLPKLFSHRE